MNNAGRFSKLLEPGQIGSVKTKSRIVKPAAEILQDPEIEAAFYGLLAKNGVALINIGTIALDGALAMYAPVSLNIGDDKQIAQFTIFTDAIHQHGCPTCMQITHAGPWHPVKMDGLQPVSASAFNKADLPMLGDEPREMTIDEIKSLIERYAKAAERAKKAGFDGIEVNAATRGLFNSFLSRVWNKRHDEYGCDTLENRSHVLCEVIKAVKEHVGKDFVVGTIINGAEWGMNLATTSEDTQGFGPLIEKAGADYIQIRAMLYPMGEIAPERYFYPELPKCELKGFDLSHYGAGGFVPLAAAIKRKVSIPVITVGNIDPILGEKILRQGQADFVSMNRRLLCDPELPAKVASGRLEDIRPCTKCFHCLWQLVKTNMEFRTKAYPIVCRANAALGNTTEYEAKPATKKKKVLVVGGGPGGLEAARVAATRGHEVLLYDKAHMLGGLIPMQALVKGVEIGDLPALIRYFRTQITKLGVKVKLGREVTPSLVKEIKPDVVIVATGGTVVVPKVCQTKHKKLVILTDLDRILNPIMRLVGPKRARWLTRFYMPVGKRVVIVGGEMHGLEVAEFLVKRGRKVTIVEESQQIGKGMELDVLSLPGWLAQKGTSILTEVKCEEITDQGLVITTKDGKRQTLEADTIMPSIIFAPNDGLAKSLKGLVPEIYTIGDCKEPRLIAEAIYEGWSVGRAI